MHPYLQKTDPKVAAKLKQELQRQVKELELIPSENYVSLSVLEALGSVATNKYAEGYPGRRYYGGCEYIDSLESLAIERAKRLFGAEHVNVQPLSGAPANIAAYSALLQPGNVIVGMDLSHGGHLTHGHPVTWMAKIFKFIRYRTTKEGLIDYDGLEELANKHRPKLILVGYSSYTRDIDYQQVKKIADKVGAYTMADIAHIAGLVAAGIMNNPVPLFDIVTTTTHKTLRGPRGGMIMCKHIHARAVDSAVFPGLQGGPHENNIAAKAVAFSEALRPEFKKYAQQIITNAKTLERAFQGSGARVLFGGTENHMLLLDVTPLGLSGRQAQELLGRAGIVVNKNVIPDDSRPPMDPSGIRLGTPAVTTRGLKEEQMQLIAKWMIEVLSNPDEERIVKKISSRVAELTRKFPLYSELTS